MDGVVVIDNRSASKNSVTVVVKNADEVQNDAGEVVTEGSFDAGTSEGYYVANSSQTVDIKPAVKIVRFEAADGEYGKRGTTALKGIPAIEGIINYSITIDGGRVPIKDFDDPVENQYAIKNLSPNKANSVVSVELKKTPATTEAETNGYADFEEVVGIIPAVHAVTFTKANGVPNVVGTKDITAVNHVDKAINVLVDNTPKTIPAEGTTVGITNSDTAKKTVSVELTDSAANNGYYIQPTDKVEIIPAVEIERRPLGDGELEGGYLDELYTKGQFTGYDYYFTTKTYPEPFELSSVTVKGVSGTASGSITAIDKDNGGFETLPSALERVSGFYPSIKKMYKISFTLTGGGKTTDNVIFKFIQPSGYYIPEVSINP